jgi:hypothetical protein
MRELRGKGWRVLGYFLWMQGAGVVLDGQRYGIARLLLAVGVALFAMGVWQSAQGSEERA